MSVLAIILAIALLALAATVAYLAIRHGQLADRLEVADAGHKDAVRDLGTAQATLDAMSKRDAALSQQIAYLGKRLAAEQAKAIHSATDEELRDEINHPDGTGAQPGPPPGDDERDRLLPFPTAAHDPGPPFPGGAVPDKPAA